MPKTLADELLDSRRSEVESAYAISKLLNTDLDRKTVAILLRLIEYGVHPESLADGKYFKPSNNSIFLKVKFDYFIYP